MYREGWFDSIDKLQVAGVDLKTAVRRRSEAHNEANTRRAYGVLNRIRHTIPNYIKINIVTALVDRDRTPESRAKIQSACLIYKHLKVSPIA